jgi:putative Holliday junction resolvase
MKLLALDIGERRIGVAVSDDAQILAYPLETVEVYAIEQAVLDVVDIICEEHPAKVYIGMPTSDDGAPSAAAKNIQAFSKLLMQELNAARSEDGAPIPQIEFTEERYTTKQAHRQLHDVGKAPSRNRDVVDQIAAVNILTEAMRVKSAPSLKQPLAD